MEGKIHMEIVQKRTGEPNFAIKKTPLRDSKYGFNNKTLLYFNLVLNIQLCTVLNVKLHNKEDWYHNYLERS